MGAIHLFSYSTQLIYSVNFFGAPPICQILRQTKEFSHVKDRHATPQHEAHSLMEKKRL